MYHLPHESPYLVLDIYFWFNVVDLVLTLDIYIHTSMLVSRHRHNRILNSHNAKEGNMTLLSIYA